MSFVSGESEAIRQPRAEGFSTLVGPDEGMVRLLVLRGLQRAGNRGSVHYHDGDEIIRVVSGEIDFLVGEEWRRCRAGDLAVVPPLVRHGFIVGETDSVIEVITELHIGSYFPVLEQDGSQRLIEVHRENVPFDRDPPPGQPHTRIEELLELVRGTAEPLEP